MCFWKIWVITIFVYFIIRDLQWCIILYIIVFKFEIICLSKKGVPLSRCQKRRLPGRLWYLFVGCDFFKEVKFWIIHIIVTVFSLSVWIFYSHVLKMLLERFLIKIINIIWTHEKKTLTKLIGTSCYICTYILFNYTMQFRISVLSMNNSTKQTFYFERRCMILFWMVEIFLTWWKECFIVQDLPYSTNNNNNITIFFKFKFS